MMVGAAALAELYGATVASYKGPRLFLATGDLGLTTGKMLICGLTATSKTTNITVEDYPRNRQETVHVVQYEMTMPSGK